MVRHIMKLTFELHNVMMWMQGTAGSVPERRDADAGEFYSAPSLGNTL